MRSLPALDKGFEYVYRVPKGILFEHQGEVFEVGSHDGVFVNCYETTSGKYQRFGMFTVVRPVKNNKKTEKKKNEVSKLRLRPNGPRGNKEKSGH